MSNSKVSKMLNGIKISLTNHSPEILTGIGIAGMITATILAVKATPKAIKLLDARKEELNKANFNKEIEKDCSLRDYKEKNKLGFKETFKTAWKCYIPSAVTCLRKYQHP